MLQSELFAKFLEMFPQFTDKVCAFEGFSEHGINMLTHSGATMEFIYHNDDWWALASYGLPREEK